MEKCAKETPVLQTANVINLSQRKEEKFITLLAEILVESALKKNYYEKSNHISENIYRQAK
jgi:hypothetical protein